MTQPLLAFTSYGTQYTNRPYARTHTHTDAVICRAVSTTASGLFITFHAEIWHWLSCNARKTDIRRTVLQGWNSHHSIWDELFCFRIFHLFFFSPRGRFARLLSLHFISHHVFLALFPRIDWRGAVRREQLKRIFAEGTKWRPLAGVKCHGLRCVCRWKCLSQNKHRESRSRREEKGRGM